MSLRNAFEKSGSWLFRYRSFLPLLCLPLFVGGLVKYQYLLTSHRVNECWQALCLLVSLAGLAVRILTIGQAPAGTSGRNTKQQIAFSLSTTGMYSVVRHPLYLGNYLIMLGFTLVFHIWWLVFLVSCIYALYYERIMMAEEAFLRDRFGERFEEWAAVTPAFIPRIHGWKAADLSFCWRTVLQREYNAFFLILAVFFLLDLIGDSVVEKRLKVDTYWFLLFLGGFAIFATLRFLKKRTQLLQVAGR
jgi:protein-S-isoprenylcysteine O-methyltransferase Ste14